MDTVCVVCLSSDRTLTQLPIVLRDLENMILPELEISTLCWECTANLKHFYKFRRRAIHSKQILDKYMKEKAANDNLIKKSNLAITQTIICCIDVQPHEFNFKNDINATNYDLGVAEKNVKLNDSKLNVEDIKKESNETESCMRENALITCYPNDKINISVLGEDEGKQRKVIKKKGKRKRRVEPVKDYVCNDCGMVFQSRGKYEYHRQKHRGRVACTICARDFSSRSALITHRNTSHITATRKDDSFRHYCKPCGKFYKTTCSYKKHLRTSVQHVDPASLKYQCAVCARRFPKAEHRDSHHELVHVQRGALRCRCGRRYCSVRALRTHVRRRHTAKYTKSRDLICELCGVTFKTAQVLKGHQRTHEREKSLSKNRN